MKCCMIKQLAILVDAHMTDSVLLVINAKSRRSSSPDRSETLACFQRQTN
jgi:hypothetical protein